MQIVRMVLMSAALLAFAPAVGLAQDRPVHFNLGGGPTFVMGDTADHFSTGWGPAVGVTFDANPKLSFQFEYAYRWFAIPDETDAAIGLLDANHQTHQLAFNLITNLTPADSAVRAYITAGAGEYYRKVEITRYAGNGVICDPYYYVCGTYPIEAVLGSRGGWDFGINIGGGVGFALGDSGEFYIETRYHHVFGPEITSATQLPASFSGSSTGGSSTGQYLPLTFGFRF
jgi:opacity protein-like surface antigen